MQAAVVLVIFLATSTDKISGCLLPRLGNKTPWENVGGENTTINHFPYHLQIEAHRPKGDWALGCGGVIFSEKIAITSATCLADVVKEKEIGKIRVIAGLTQSGEDTKQSIHYVEQVELHPKFVTNGKFGENGLNDICLVKLKTPIEFGKNIKPIKIVGEEPKVGDVGVGGGWGSLGYRKHYAKIMRSINVKVIDRKICEDAYKKEDPKKEHFEITDGVLCCSYPKSKTHHIDACVQENGAPVAMNGELMGLASQDLSCKKPGLPGIYTNVFHFKNWIEKTAAKMSSASD